MNPRFESTSLLALLFTSTLAVACRPPETPAAIERATSASDSKAIERARKTVPEAVGRADRLRDEAKDLHAAGREVESDVVAEQAEVAYRHAIALEASLDIARRAEAAESEVKKAKEELALLDGKQQKLSADADALERKIQVLLALEPGSDVEKLSGERAIARRKAALELSLEARTLCLVARLLDPKAPGLDALDERNAKLDADLKVGAIAKDIFPTATALRNECLEVATSVRRPATQKAPEEGLPDRLLRALTETGKFFAFKDDRGVVVSLTQAELGGTTLSKGSEEKLDLLAKIAKENSSFPVLVVVHAAKKGQDKTTAALLAKIADQLGKSGATNVSKLDAGYAKPVVNPRLNGADERNARAEIVFVAPTL